MADDPTPLLQLAALMQEDDGNDPAAIAVLQLIRSLSGATSVELAVPEETAALWPRVVLEDPTDRVVAQLSGGDDWFVVATGLALLGSDPTLVGVLQADGTLEVIAAAGRVLVRQAVDRYVASMHAAEVEDARRRLTEQNIQLRELAVVDELTGLHNRRFLERRVAYEVDRASRYGRALALLVLDVDHFKKVNDTYGHSAGDEVLRRLANVARNGCRRQDLIARFGGEEFVLVAPETGAEGALVLAERVRVAVAAEQFEVDGIRFQVTVSIGVAVLLLKTTDSTTLFRAADAALYMAKRSGRNRVVIADQTIPPPS